MKIVQILIKKKSRQ